MRNVRKEVLLLLDGYTREEIEEYWETKSNELAEETWEKWVAKIIEQSAEKYFSMPNEVFNNTKCQDTEKYSSEELKKMEYVGLYKKEEKL